MEDSTPRICVVGSLNMDLTVRAARLPAPGETILGGVAASSPGGKGANQAVAAARLGASVSMIGRVGDDEHGRALIRLLAECGVAASSVEQTPGTATGLGFITVGEGGENTIVVASGANALLTPDDVERHRAAITAADVLLLQLEVPAETNLRAAETARNAGVTVVLNAAPASGAPDGLLALADVLIVNEVEAGALGAIARQPSGAIARQSSGATARESWSAAVPTLLAGLSRLPVETIILTLGACGCVGIRQRGRPIEVPAFPVTPMDTVGAGDAFVGAFAARWAVQQVAGGLDEPGFLDSLHWGNAAGALAATRHGAIPSMPTRAEVVALLRGH